MIDENLLDLIYYGCYGLVLLPLLVGLRYWTRLSIPNRLLWTFLLTLLLIEITGNVLRMQQIRNHFLHYLVTLAELWFGAWFYARVNNWRWTLRVAAGVSLLIPVEVWGWVGFNHINSLTHSLSLLLLAGYALWSLWRAVEQNNSNSLRQSPYFYQHLGFLAFGFFPAFTIHFKAYFIEVSLDLYFFSDTLGVILQGVAFCLFAIGLNQSRLYAPAQLAPSQTAP